jgi:hypothetical protein
MNKTITLKAAMIEWLMNESAQLRSFATDGLMRFAHGANSSTSCTLLMMSRQCLNILELAIVSVRVVGIPSQKLHHNRNL